MQHIYPWLLLYRHLTDHRKLRLLGMYLLGCLPTQAAQWFTAASREPGVMVHPEVTALGRGRLKGQKFKVRCIQ